VFMGRKDRQRYSRDFKIEAVKRSFEPGKTAAGVARELDIPLHQLYRWRDDVTHKQDEAFPGSGKTSANTELEQLRRENKRLREERDILKKSLIFFAREQGKDTSLSENLQENSK